MLKKIEEIKDKMAKAEVELHCLGIELAKAHLKYLNSFKLGETCLMDGKKVRITGMYISEKEDLKDKYDTGIYAGVELKELKLEVLPELLTKIIKKEENI